MGASTLSCFALLLMVAHLCTGNEWQHVVPYAPTPDGLAPINYTRRWSAVHDRGTMAKLGGLNLVNFMTQGVSDRIRKMTSTSATSNCQQDVALLLGMVADPKTQSTAFRYIDAAAKPPKGLMNGNLMWVGDYQECNDIDAVRNPATGKTFTGKYFTTVVFMNNKPIYQTLPLLAGVCFPNSCNEVEVTVTMEYALLALQQNSSIIRSLNLSVVGAISEPDDQNVLQGGVLATVVLTSIIVAVIIVGTFVDIFRNWNVDTQAAESKVSSEPPVTVYSHDDTTDRTGLLSGEVFTDSGSYRVHVQDSTQCGSVKRLMFDVLCAFSFLSNAKKLFGTETAKGPLACLNGIRVISMWWVILGHTYVFIIYFLDNSLSFEAGNLIKRFTFQPILNGTFSVDAFFFLSGLLVAYLSIKEVRDKGMGVKFWVYFVCHRYWRLTPLYAFIIILYTFLTPVLVSGPYWYMIMPTSQLRNIAEECKSTWWANLLYINNFYPYYGNIGKVCMGWTWYLANDMQFYLFVSPILIFLLSRERRMLRVVGLLLATYFILSCISVRGFFVSYYGIHGLMAQPTKNANDPLSQNDPMYVRPYTRVAVYIIGIMVGYILAVQNCRIHIPRFAALLGWVTFICVGMSVIYGPYYYNHHGTLMPIVASGFYVSMCRALFSLCLAWLVLACVSGNAGPLKDILSWKMWAPLGRLTYAAYLIHPVVIYIVYMNQLTPIHFTDLNMVYWYIGNLVLSYGLAFVLSMMVEAPMIQLEKALIKNKSIFMEMFRSLGRFRRRNVNTD